MTSINDYSVEELVQALKAKGVFVTITGQGVGHSTEEIGAPSRFGVLRQIDDYFRAREHVYDLRKEIKVFFGENCRYDWARKIPGRVSDAMKKIIVGTGENYDGEQVLLIKHFDTEVKYDTNSSWPNHPPVWGIGFSASELLEVQKGVIENLETCGTLIHREPEGEIDPNEPWFEESHWLIEGGKITGVKLNVKCTQDECGEEKWIRFKLRGSRFEVNGDIETIRRPAKAALGSAATNVPEPSYVGDVHVVSSEQKTAKTDYVPEGNSALQIRIAENATGEVRNWNWSTDLKQSYQTPHLIITNPTDKQISITEFFMEFQDANGLYVRSETNKVGVPTRGYYGGTEVYWVEQQSFEIPEHASADVVYNGSLHLKAPDGVSNPPMDLVAYNGRPYSEWIHHQFPNPLVTRLTVKDDSGNTLSLGFEYANPVLDQVWDTYEGALAAGNSSDGFNADHQCDFFLCVENKYTNNKNYVIVTSAKDKPTEWFVRTCNDSRGISGSYDSFGKDYIRKISFKNKISKGDDKKTDRIELFSREGSYASGSSKLYGLLDEQGNVYAWQGEVIINYESEVKVVAKKSAIIDFDRLEG